MMEAEMEDDAMMKGGEPAIGDIKDYFKLKQYENDTEDYSGNANIAKLLLKQTIVNPAFGDSLKDEILKYDKRPYSYNANYDKDKTKEKEKGGQEEDGAWLILGAIGAFVKSGAAGSESKDVWFFGTLDANHLKSLKYVHSKNDSVVFPGIMAGWESEEEAKSNSVNWCSEENR